MIKTSYSWRKIFLVLTLKALIYFQDAEEERSKRKVKIFDKKAAWEQVKKGIFEKVKAYQLGMFKK